MRFVGLPMRHAVRRRQRVEAAAAVPRGEPDVDSRAQRRRARARARGDVHAAGRRVRRQSRRLVSARSSGTASKYRTRRVDRVVTVCEQIKDVIVASGGLPPEKVVVVYAGTDVALFDPDKWDARAFRREKGIADDRFLIAQVGVRDWKGWKELIDAVAVDPADASARASRADRLPRCERAGARCMTYARRARRRRSTSRAVEYRADMPNVFASCDLVVDASWAGTGITGTIREAMAMRKPVIATDCGGNRELRLVARRRLADSGEGSRRRWRARSPT